MLDEYHNLSLSSTPALLHPPPTSTSTSTSTQPPTTSISSSSSTSAIITSPVNANDTQMDNTTAATFTATGPGITSDTGSSPPAPKAILSSSADLSPGISTTTPPIPQRSPSPYLDPQSILSQADQPTPRPLPRQSQSQPTSSPTTSTLHLHPFDPTHQPHSSRPTSQTSFTSTSSRGGNGSTADTLTLPNPSSPLCTPKLRDFAYPRTHKYHAPNFNSQRYSVSSRSSTSSDLESFFPQRIGTQLYVTSEDWPGQGQGQGQGQGREDGIAEGFDEVDGDEEEIVERRAVCIFDFTAECQGEISIEIGQVVWVEFRKGVSGWLVVRDEITGLVPEGYVRFLNEDEERQYLEQSPPSNTLLPKDPNVIRSGEDTPRVTDQSTQSQQRTWHQNEKDWAEDSKPTSGGEDWVGLTTAVEHVRVER